MFRARWLCAGGWLCGDWRNAGRGAAPRGDGRSGAEREKHSLLHQSAVGIFTDAVGGIFRGSRQQAGDPAGAARAVGGCLAFARGNAGERCEHQYDGENDGGVPSGRGCMSACALGG